MDPTSTTGMVDASSMIASIMQSFPAVVMFINAFGSLAGIAITVLGLIKFTNLPPRGDGRLVTAVMWVFVGCALINLASSVQTILVTLFGTGADVHNLLAYTSDSGLSQGTQQLIQALVACTRLYGLWCAIRGLMTLRHVGDPGHREGGAFKSGGLKFIFGCLLLNIVQTVSVVATTTGWGSGTSLGT
jgi:hypothetical protein